MVSSPDTKLVSNSIATSLLNLWTKPPWHSTSRAVAFPMLAEHLSGKRILLGPAFNWRRSHRYLRDMHWYREKVERFPVSVRRWLRSGAAFTEPRDISLISSTLGKAPGLKVGLPDIVAVLSENPAPTIPRVLHRQRSYLYWYLCGMPIEVLAELSQANSEYVQSGIVGALEELLSRIGFMIYAYQVDVACIIGGDMDIPYLKRLLLAKGSMEKPLLKSNRAWKKYVQSMYHRDPSLLRQMAGTSPPRQTTSLFLVKSRRSLE